MFKNHSNPDGPPCRFMEHMLQAAADGRAKPLTRWYVLAHAARCTRCRKFLDSLTRIISGLRQAKPAATDAEAISRLEGLVRRHTR
jgi:predicted anti-sigma-YlaC factor YlaD